MESESFIESGDAELRKTGGRAAEFIGACDAYEARIEIRPDLAWGRDSPDWVRSKRIF